MKASDGFNTFYGEFTRLALESKRDEDLQKEDLFEKLLYKLQMMMIEKVYDDNVSLDSFVDSCRRNAIGITRVQT
jgi:hypothetical protein